MASPRCTPFIATWESDYAFDATVPLDEIGAGRSTTPSAGAPADPSATAPSRLAWAVVGIAGMLAAGALLWAAEGGGLRASAVERPAPTPPPPIRAELQAYTARIEMSQPDIVLADVDEPSAPPRVQPGPSRPARTVVKPRDELAAALLERRRQLSRMGIAHSEVETVAAISFDPSRSSARVVYEVRDSAAEVVEYWAVRNGRWQALDD